MIKSDSSQKEAYTILGDFKVSITIFFNIQIFFSMNFIYYSIKKI